MSATNIPAPGTKAHFWNATDRHPCTVVSVSPSGSRLIVRRVEVTRWADSYGEEFRDDEAGETWVFTRRKDGRYRAVGADYGGISFAGWAAYQGPSF
jgi:hypothetical protein